MAGNPNRPTYRTNKKLTQVCFCLLACLPACLLACLLALLVCFLACLADCAQRDIREHEKQIINRALMKLQLKELRYVCWQQASEQARQASKQDWQAGRQIDRQRDSCTRCYLL